MELEMGLEPTTCVVARCARQAYPVGTPWPRSAAPPFPTAQGRVGDPSNNSIARQG